MNNKKKILTYSIFAVILLILLVVGSTYAFFNASVSNNNGIKGGTASAPNLELTVNKISTGASGNLIPLDNDVNSLTSAVRGYGFTGTVYDNTKSCIDKNGYSVCQVYEITIKNNSTASVVLNGGVTVLEGRETPNVACAVMNTSISVTNNASCISNTSIANNVKFESGETNIYYIMVYINNLHKEQYDAGDFFGTVSFSSVNGGVTADFD